MTVFCKICRINGNTRTVNFALTKLFSLYLFYRYRKRRTNLQKGSHGQFYSTGSQCVRSLCNIFCAVAMRNAILRNHEMLLLKDVLMSLSPPYSNVTRNQSYEQSITWLIKWKKLNWRKLNLFQKVAFTLLASLVRLKIPFTAYKKEINFPLVITALPPKLCLRAHNSTSYAS